MKKYLLAALDYIALTQIFRDENSQHKKTLKVLKKLVLKMYMNNIF